MSINVKNAEAERLLAELKERTGRGTTDLLLDLLRREKARLERDVEAEVARAVEDTLWLQETWSALPVIDPRPLGELIQYDENGLPV
jgi:hypothetical protein